MEKVNSCMMGFNGERIDPVSGTSFLGNGYRSYQPVFFRFAAPDFFSPFGAGGLNSYAYCASDPINRADPSGHMSVQGWLGIGIGIFGLGLAIFSAGASIAATGGMMAAMESASAMSLMTGGAGVLSDVAAIASGAAEDRDPESSAMLGWVSLGAGMIGMLNGVKGWVGKLNGDSSRPFRGLMMTDEQPPTGQFRTPRYLGASTGGNAGFDFLFEDTTERGLRRLNIVTQSNVQYGRNPVLPIYVWNEAHKANEIIQYIPESGTESILNAYFLDTTGRRYPVYRFGTSHAAALRGAVGTEGNWSPRSFVKMFSSRMRGSFIQASVSDVTCSGPAFEHVRFAVEEVHQQGAHIHGSDGQKILDLINHFYGEQTGAFDMTSDGWVTYYNGK